MRTGDDDTGGAGGCSAGVGPPVVVAVADDVLRDNVAATLAGEGYAVETAATAPAALAALERPGRPSPALLLLDHRLAVLDGIPLAAWYRRQPGPHAPLLLLGAPAGPAGPTNPAEPAAVAPGAAGVVGLPVDVGALLATVARLTRLAVLAEGGHAAWPGASGAGREATATDGRRRMSWSG